MTDKKHTQISAQLASYTMDYLQLRQARKRKNHVFCAMWLESHDCGTCLWSINVSLRSGAVVKRRACDPQDLRLNLVEVICLKAFGNLFYSTVSTA